MSAKLELIQKRQSVALWDGWGHRMFACTQHGHEGWYTVLVHHSSMSPRMAYAPKASRIQRPHRMFWRRTEVLRYFRRRIERFKALQVIEQGRAA